jgi:polyhydroxybutyrate depolymerase
MEWQGYERNYLVYAPGSLKESKKAPLLFHLHGGGGTAQGTPGLTFNKFNQLAEKEGFIVVYPNAIDKNWNDGRSFHFKNHDFKDIDDVGFILQIIDQVSKKHLIDRDRIFSTGMSNGGFMTTRLLCDEADVFRGGAILTAQISEDYFPKCNPGQPVGVLVMNGTADELVPYDGGEIKVLGQKRGEIISTDEYIDFWRKHNGCETTPNETLTVDTKDDGTSVQIDKYSGCDNRGALELYTINNGGHTWPGGKQYLGERLIGKTSRDINACEVIWDFFKSLN